MSYDFTAQDIFVMAEQIERNGAEFYRKAAKAAGSEKARAFLENLAAMEDEHEKVFASLKAGLSAREKAPTVFDPLDETGAYLQSLADVRVFFEKTIDVASMEAVLKAAIEAEKDSIVFYLGMKDLVPEKLGKDKINAIIKEEMGHIRVLSRELIALK